MDELKYEVPPPLTDVERYSFFLLIEEMGEALQAVGKAGRFGIDTPGIKDPLSGKIDYELTPRVALAKECGDILAAIDYTISKGVIDGETVTKSKNAKKRKLFDPLQRDNLGRRLAP